MALGGGNRAGSGGEAAVTGAGSARRLQAPAESAGTPGRRSRFPRWRNRILGPRSRRRPSGGREPSIPRAARSICLPGHRPGPRRELRRLPAHHSRRRFPRGDIGAFSRAVSCPGTLGGGGSAARLWDQLSRIGMGGGSEGCSSTAFGRWRRPALFMARARSSADCRRCQRSHHLQSPCPGGSPSGERCPNGRRRGPKAAFGRPWASAPLP